jgi:peptidoglycan/xylan/chitin deacetylase (PgdA/CDA1 family)
MKYLFTQIFTLLVSVSYAQDKNMCITVDDLPVVSYGIEDPEFHLQVTQNLIRTFDKYNIPAIGYVNELKLYDGGRLDSNQVQLLELWLKNGYELGNHTFSHKNYHRVPFAEFTTDVTRGEKVSRELSEKYGLPYQYFRHPYLRLGLSEAHADSLRMFLSEQGYTEAPVTIDNEGYIFAKAYHNAFQQDDQQLMQKIGEAYLKYMTDKMLFYEESSKKLFERNISQTLLIHASLLNAHYLDELAQIYIEHGYRFISQTDALKDPAYDSPFTRYGDWGISWIDRWALTRGVGREFFEGDPVTPEFVHKLNN